MTEQNIFYWDSSALIKCYVTENGSKEVFKLFSSPAKHFTSVITHAEILATIYRIQREGLSNKKETETLASAFLHDWPLIGKVPYNKEVQETAQQVIKSSPLRGADLAHLASAVRLKKEGLNVQFLSFDLRLNKAAQDNQLEILF